jgi:hypothetical protein
VRIRSIVPAFWSSLTLAKVTREQRLFFEGLWSCADDHGRGLADPRWLKGQLFAFDDDLTPAILEEWLTLLASPAINLIVLYQGPKGQPLYAVRSWSEHQHPQRPSPSKHPAPPTEAGAVPSISGTPPGTIPDTSGDRPPRPRERSSQEGSGGERSGGGEKTLKGSSLPRSGRDRAPAGGAR